MVSVGGGDQVMGIEAGEERGLVLRTGVSHSDVSGRTWARVTSGYVPCSEARSVEVTRPEVRSYEVREPSVSSSKPQTTDTSQNSKNVPYYTSQDKLPRPSPELAEAGERILQVCTLYYLPFTIECYSGHGEKYGEHGSGHSGSGHPGQVGGAHCCLGCGWRRDAGD